MSRGRELAAVPATAPLEPVDPRVQQMRCLAGPGVLGEEWDACRAAAHPVPRRTTLARSPVRNQPSVIASAVASGLCQYPFMML